METLEICTGGLESSDAEGLEYCCVFLSFKKALLMKLNQTKVSPDNQGVGVWVWCLGVRANLKKF